MEMSNVLTELSAAVRVMYESDGVAEALIWILINECR